MTNTTDTASASLAAAHGSANQSYQTIAFQVRDIINCGPLPSNYKDNGEIEIASADAANIPVNSFLCEPDEDSPNWRWIADNFMPRKGRVAEGQYNIEADSKELLFEAVQKYVVPLYEAALENLKTHGACYYWKRKTESTERPSAATATKTDVERKGNDGNPETLSVGRSGSLERVVRRQPSSRKVWLKMHDGRLLVAKATLTEAGWVARWIDNNDAWSILLPDGKVRGTSLVIAWLPHTGWNDGVTMPPTAPHRN